MSILIPIPEHFGSSQRSLLYSHKYDTWASGLTMSSNGAPCTLLRTRLAQHCFLYRPNVLLSFVMTVQRFRRAPTGACNTGSYAAHRLARLPPMASVTLSWPASWNHLDFSISCYYC
ncbi:hypothetical protein K443DRAFT_223823 [Laccaria amethystina LaAM-08-1]|uniref:Uncharacterized protein n=1 Tax=Laccaria amethystina LaAM-08-1 TaxID=1095629 RepID=A0A0C9XPU7_9AGAR|nr:hypothetical protein K443DRAFT_223823 [Laccaria amethystina LaAM-08-1]